MKAVSASLVAGVPKLVTAGMIEPPMQSVRVANAALPISSIGILMDMTSLHAFTMTTAAMVTATSEWRGHAIRWTLVLGAVRLQI